MPFTVHGSVLYDRKGLIMYVYSVQNHYNVIIILLNAKKMTEIKN